MLGAFEKRKACPCPWDSPLLLQSCMVLTCWRWGLAPTSAPSSTACLCSGSPRHGGAVPFCSLPLKSLEQKGIFFFQASGKSLFIVGWGHPSRSSCSWDHPPGQSVSPNPREGKEHPSPLLPSLKQCARTVLQGRALQTSQPPKRPNTLLEDVLSNRHG